MRELIGGPFGLDQNAAAILPDVIGNNSYIRVRSLCARYLCAFVP